jgi:hypothetical protein
LIHARSPSSLSSTLSPFSGRDRRFACARHRPKPCY